MSKVFVHAFFMFLCYFLFSFNFHYRNCPNLKLICSNYRGQDSFYQGSAAAATVPCKPQGKYIFKIS